MVYLVTCHLKGAVDEYDGLGDWLRGEGARLAMPSQWVLVSEHTAEVVHHRVCPEVQDGDSVLVTEVTTPGWYSDTLSEPASVLIRGSCRTMPPE